MAKCKRCETGEECSFEHGRPTGYKYHGCRCDPCRSAMTTERKGQRSCRACASGQSHEFMHGRNGYDYHGCRCDICLGAMAARNLRRYYKNPELHLERMHGYYLRNRTRKIEYARDYELANVDFVRERKRERYIRTRGDVLDRCRVYRNSPAGQRTKDRKRAKQDRIPKPNHGHPWTEAETWFALRDDLTVVEIAYQLGRSYQAVTSRRINQRKLAA